MSALFKSEYLMFSNSTTAAALRNRVTGTTTCTSGVMKLISAEKSVAFRFPVASLIQLWVHQGWMWNCLVRTWGDCVCVCVRRTLLWTLSVAMTSERNWRWVQAAFLTSGRHCDDKHAADSFTDGRFYFWSEPLWQELECEQTLIRFTLTWASGSVVMLELWWFTFCLLLFRRTGTMTYTPKAASRPWRTGYRETWTRSPSSSSSSHCCR